MSVLLEKLEIQLTYEEQFNLHKQAVLCHLLSCKCPIELQHNIKHHLEGMERAFQEK